VRRAALFLVPAVLVAGCGGGSSSSEQSKPAERIATDAQKAARSAGAVHVSGSIVERGARLSLDLHLVRNTGAVGRMGLKGGTIKLVRVGSKVYMNGNTAFWAAYGGPAAAQLYANRWLTIPTSSAQIAPFVALTDIDKLFGGAVGSHGKIEKDGTITYRGHKVIVLKEAGGAGGTLYVAASGTPYPLALLGPGAGAQGTLAFDQWNRKVPISAPKGTDTLPSG
jgi:hypothetical protein